MKTLAAENDFGYQKQTIALADIMISETESVLDNKWAEFSRQKAIAEHIAANGLKNPIIVVANGDKYRFAASGARIQFAVKNGYTHIDAIVLTDDADIKPLMVEQAKTEEQYLDPQHIHRWWEGTQP
jgi:hypothetical protein